MRLDGRGGNSKSSHATIQWKYVEVACRQLPFKFRIRGHRRERSNMFEVTVEAGFSSGHFLRNYRGKCENPHGHNYKVFITLVGERLDEAGMLLDFKLLKQVMRPTVDYLDHFMINDLPPFDKEMNPSAENLA